MNAFEKMATPKTESKKSSVNKIAAAVTDAIKIAVDKVIDLKGKLKSLEAEQAQAEEAIISHVKPQYRKAGKEGNFTKTFVVQGNVGALNFTATDRFSVPQEQDALDEIEKAVGKKRFGEWLIPEYTVTVKESVIQNDALVAKIMKALEDAGIENIFESKKKIVACTDLDRKIMELSDLAYETLSSLIKQAKPSLK